MVGQATKLFTRREIEPRNHKDDAVFVIDNVVYDVTKFLEDHPGGVEVLVDNAGRDASQCFHDVGHSEDAQEWMKKFVVGGVVEGDRLPVKKKEIAWGGGEEGITLSGLVSACAPPLGFAALATLMYFYVFA